MPTPDPILQELRSVRDTIASAGDQDMRKIAEAARTRQKSGGREVVGREPKRVDSTRKAS
jgi:hypothetical protein